MKVKTSIGEFEIKSLTWRQIKDAKLLDLVKKFGASKEDPLMLIDEDDMERAARVVVGDRIDDLTFEDVMNIFTAVIEGMIDAKK